MDLSRSELHNSRSGPLVCKDVQKSKDFQMLQSKCLGLDFVAMFLSQTVTVLRLPSLRQELKELEEQREQRRPEVEVNTDGRMR